MERGVDLTPDCQLTKTMIGNLSKYCMVTLKKEIACRVVYESSMGLD